MRFFLQRHGSDIAGVLSGFDRLRFRGMLRSISYATGMGQFIGSIGVRLTQFKGFAEQTAKRIRRRTHDFAEKMGRPIRYLDSPTIDKQHLVDDISEEQGATRDGWIAVLSAMELCRTYDIHRNPSLKQLELYKRSTKCLHDYFYFMDSMFGRGYVRLQTKFPFDVCLYINGREWLARQLDQAKVGYLRSDNCFVHIDDFDRAQKLAHRQRRIAWWKHLDRLRRKVHPCTKKSSPSIRPTITGWSTRANGPATWCFVRPRPWTACWTA